MLILIKQDNGHECSLLYFLLVCLFISFFEKATIRLFCRINSIFMNQQDLPVNHLLYEHYLFEDQ